MINNRYSTFVRSNGVYYALDRQTLKQTSLRTTNEAEALRLIAAKNQAVDTPQLNRSMARIYASAASPELMERTWQAVIDAYILKAVPTTRVRLERAFGSQPFKVLTRLKVNETDASAFWAVLNHRKAGNAANHFLRRLQNFAWGMRWLFEPVIPNPLWPKVKKRKTIAITAEEQAKILASEKNPERRRYYELLWETGGSQSDIAQLTWDRVDSKENTITFYRDKLDEREDGDDYHGLSKLVIGPRIRTILNECPPSGALFPGLCRGNPAHRSTEFKRRCRVAGIKNRQLKSYRYGWAQRARAAGMPEREAMNHLGHKSKAVHQAYAADAKVVTFSLEHYEEATRLKVENQKNNIIKFEKTGEATGT